jgi:uncharacterized protein (DUF58 family)
MTTDSFLSPELLAQVKNLSLAARYVAEGAIGGFHKSVYIGHNAEFSHHREYMPGDEIRRIDWKRFGKSERFYVRQYEESTSLNALILLDQSASMGVKVQVGIRKDLYAKTLVAALTYLLLHQHDGVGFCAFSDKMLNFLPVSTKMTQFSRLLNYLEAEKESGGTDFLNAVENLAPLLKKKCLIIIISDFLEQETQLLQTVRLLRFHRHEIMALHILSGDELNFPYDGFGAFTDVETGQKMEIEARVARKFYDESLQNYLKEIKLSMHKNMVDYNLFPTSVPLEKVLIHYLHKRSRLR